MNRRSAAAAPARLQALRPDAAPLAARGARQRSMADARRSHVLDAARAAFFELGLEGASLREIAKRAGYTPGALYSYFNSKEEVYGALLGESLDRLNQCVDAAEPAPQTAPEALAHATLRAKATAFFDFYRERPRDLDLGFYLFHGMKPQGLTPELDARLNARLADALAPSRCALEAAGLDRAQAHAEVTSLFAQIAGLLLLSHTGRMRMFRLEPGALFARYLDALLERLRPAVPLARRARAR